jgi:starch synthase
MQILHVSSEVAPFAKVGGLADVIMGLSLALQEKGHDIHILIPSYGFIQDEKLVFDGKIERFTTQLDGRFYSSSVRYCRFDNKISILLLDTEDGYWSKLSSVYGNGIERFTFFCRAVADWLKITKLSPDVVHVHDWPTSLLPILSSLKRSVFTVHNFEFQGRCQWKNLERIGLSSDETMEILQISDGSLNLVKGGVLAADKVTTVSPTYAKEVMTPQFGKGLESVLHDIQDKFSGILNGIDTSYWNPQTDKFLFEHYSAKEGYEKVCKAKLHNKEKLFQEIGLPLKKEVPLLTSVTRLVSQKGIWLLHDLFSQAEEFGFQAILLGSVPDVEARAPFEELDQMLREKERGAILFKSDEECAHRLFAASDMFVAPSLFEPCGLTQLISLRYGTVPIVRKTGGFADTIVDVSEGEEANCFSCTDPISLLLQEAVRNALEYYKDEESWQRLVMRGMRQEFSWKKSADKYLSLYQS